MKKLTLTIAEVLQLQQELLGSQKAEGILTLKMNMLAKYRLSKLEKSLQEEIKTFEKIQLELFEKYGKQEGPNGAWTIPTVIDIVGEDDQVKKEVHPNYLKFQEEIQPIMKEVKEFDIPHISIEDFKDVEVDGYFPIFFEKIIINSEEEKQD